MRYWELVKQCSPFYLHLKFAIYFYFFFKEKMWENQCSSKSSSSISYVLGFVIFRRIYVITFILTVVSLKQFLFHDVIWLKKNLTPTWLLLIVLHFKAYAYMYYLYLTRHKIIRLEVICMYRYKYNSRRCGNRIFYYSKLFGNLHKI